MATAHRVSALLGGAPPALVHGPSGLAAWIVQPIGFLLSLGDTKHIDARMARFVTGEVHARLLEIRGAAAEPFQVLNDWATMEGYETPARTILTKWAFAHRHEIARVAVVLPPARPLVRMGVEVAASSLRLAGVRVELAASITDVIGRHGVTAHPRSR